MQLTLLMVALSGMVGCAIVPSPVDRLEAARLSIVEAERVGALEDAPLELYIARERLEQAKQSMTEKKYVEARRLADDAVVNAELGRAKAQGAKNQRAADELREEVDSVATEIDRNVRQ
jgi:hypothetical protein